MIRIKCSSKYATRQGGTTKNNDSIQLSRRFLPFVGLKLFGLCSCFILFLPFPGCLGSGFPGQAIPLHFFKLLHVSEGCIPGGCRSAGPAMKLRQGITTTLWKVLVHGSPSAALSTRATSKVCPTAFVRTG